MLVVLRAEKEYLLQLLRKVTINKLKKSFEFRRAKNAPLKLQSYNLSLQLTASELGSWRLGITVSTKVDKRAVIRNRMKRILRSAFQSLRPKLQGSFDIVIIARKDFSAMSSQDVAKELQKLLQGKSLLKA